ncbi:MAG: 30S ribosomal protein S20 [Planctomycetota bacterium]|jgi:small subunit ribosomal protein S20|nr:30S ribosomal protein S20 [Planctomycetota bacterium]MDP6370742.1 30S ribosomal protein S20 [Planctomycetota bacterium]MDP6521019.1 30S ribosomal protein S20 [Planctomycetota bacterium]MDP6838742.1 30S ribosomal protein S20 [Planctomycetota bacterium]MDP6955807.1 30S ribosomal protein S20 [Planctomycetota bacterium]
MPNNKQAAKRLRQNETRRQANKAVSSRMRSAVKKVMQAETPEEAATNLSEAIKRVDKAAKKNIIHANAAARKKSQLQQAANG